MNAILTTKHGVPTSPQVSNLINADDAIKTSAGWVPGFVFLIKVVSDEGIQCEILPASADPNVASSWIETTLAAGWNPELVQGIRNASLEAGVAVQVGW